MYGSADQNKTAALIAWFLVCRFLMPLLNKGTHQVAQIPEPSSSPARLL
jgi:hypothetical protein